ncbi:MAG: DUF3090 family protein [Actinomycetia bacterium]|nr:DUF3090 family protein [Actinomycetes bacterium]MCP4960711.1 DUF3090 family protein [Actinomycetes bacterium]
MSESFELLNTTNVVAGTVGAPGERIFFLQARDETTLVSVKLEKGQVQALASGILELLEQIGDESDPLKPADLVEPVMAIWTVGSLGVGIDEEAGRFVILAEELVEGEEEASTCRFHTRFAQARGFATHALLLAEYGRDFGRRNGHRRH